MRRRDIQECVKAQRAWKEGQRITFGEAHSFCRSRWPDVAPSRVKDACRDLIMRGEATQLDVSGFQRHDRKWLKRKWRTLTDEELAIE